MTEGLSAIGSYGSLGSAGLYGSYYDPYMMSMMGGYGSYGMMSNPMMMNAMGMMGMYNPAFMGNTSDSTSTNNPYINYMMAKAILDYRRLKGPLQSMQDLRLLPDFTPENIRRIEPYIEF